MTPLVFLLLVATIIGLWLLSAVDELTRILSSSPDDAEPRDYQI